MAAARAAAAADAAWCGRWACGSVCAQCAYAKREARKNKHEIKIKENCNQSNDRISVGPMEEMSVRTASCGWKLPLPMRHFRGYHKSGTRKIAATQRDTAKTQTCAAKGPVGDGDEPDRRRRALCAAGRDMAVELVFKK